MKRIIFVFLILFGYACGPSPKSEGLKWNINDLATYLQQRGLKFEVKPIEEEDLFIPGALYVFKFDNSPNEKEGVIVLLNQTEQRAHDAVVNDEKMNSFDWGRFLFLHLKEHKSQEEHYLQIQNLLK